MKRVQTFEEYINENILSDTWNKIVEFFSSSVQNTIRKVKKSDSEREKEKLLNTEIEKQAKEYIKLVKKDDEVFTLMKVTDDLFKLFELYKSITGKKHNRHVWRSGYFEGTFVWPELLKVKSEDEIVKHYNKKIDDLNNSVKREIKNLEKEREQFSNLLKSKDLNEGSIVDSYEEFINEAKRKTKKKKSSLVSKSDVNKAFKDAGVGFVTMSTGSYSRPKTHSSKLKGVKGGSVGPMTATSAWRDHNRKAERDLYNKLLNTFSRNNEVKFTTPSGDGFDMFVEDVAKGKQTVYRFRWTRFPSNVTSRGFDPSYQSYWLTYTVNEEPMN